MTQAKMHDYFIRQNQEQTAITYEKEDLNFEAGFKKVDWLLNNQMNMLSSNQFVYHLHFQKKNDLCWLNNYQSKCH